MQQAVHDVLTPHPCHAASPGCEATPLPLHPSRNELAYRRWRQRQAVFQADSGDAPPLAYRWGWLANHLNSVHASGWQG